MSAGDHGVVVLDKPAGATSHDVVQWVRWALHERAVGHCGTLDPAATGVLVLCVGEATKLVEHLHAADKRYHAVIELGLATTTGDAEGEPIARAQLPVDALARAIAAAEALHGALSLPPPAFSAIKQAGVPSHVRARRGEAVELAPRTMHVHEVRVLGSDAAHGRLAVELAVGKGTYVRAWAVALGDAIGVPAHLAGLRRLASGSSTLDDALHGLVASPREGGTVHAKPRVRLELGALDRDGVAATLRAAMLEPIRALPPGWARGIATDPERFERLCQGLPQWASCVGIDPELSPGLGAIADPEHRRLVLARLDHEDGHLRVFPTRVLRLERPPLSPASGA